MFESQDAELAVLKATEEKAAQSLRRARETVEAIESDRRRGEPRASLLAALLTLQRAETAHGIAVDALRRNHERRQVLRRRQAVAV